MNSQLSRTFFASFVFASLLSLAIALIYGVLILIIIPIVGGRFEPEMILAIMGLVLGVCFVSSLIAFLAIQAIKKYWIPDSDKKESIVTLSLAAAITNLWLILPGLDQNFWGLYLLNFFVSLMIILFGGRIYQRVIDKLRALNKTHLQTDKSSADS